MPRAAFAPRKGEFRVDSCRNRAAYCGSVRPYRKAVGVARHLETAKSYACTYLRLTTVFLCLHAIENAPNVASFGSTRIEKTIEKRGPEEDWQGKSEANRAP